MINKIIFTLDKSGLIAWTNEAVLKQESDGTYYDAKCRERGVETLYSLLDYLEGAKNVDIEYKGIK